MNYEKSVGVSGDHFSFFSVLIQKRNKRNQVAECRTQSTRFRPCHAYAHFPQKRSVKFERAG